MHAALPPKPEDIPTRHLLLVVRDVLEAESAKSNLNEIWNEIPEEWLTDSHGDPRPGLNLTEVGTILAE